MRRRAKSEEQPAQRLGRRAKWRNRELLTDSVRTGRRLSFGSPVASKKQEAKGKMQETRSKRKETVCVMLGAHEPPVASVSGWRMLRATLGRPKVKRGVLSCAFSLFSPLTHRRALFFIAGNLLFFSQTRPLHLALSSSFCQFLQTVSSSFYRQTDART